MSGPGSVRPGPDDAGGATADGGMRWGRWRTRRQARRLGLTAGAVLMLHAWLVGGGRPLLPQADPSPAPSAWHVQLRPATAGPLAQSPARATAPGGQTAQTMPPPAAPPPPRRAAAMPDAALAHGAPAKARPPVPDNHTAATPLAGRDDGAGEPVILLAEPLPLYEPRLPEAAELHFDAIRGAMRGRAVLRWTPQNGRYEVELIVTPEAGSGATLRQHSTGAIGGHGLEPQRFVDQRNGRGQRAANFRRALVPGPDGGHAGELSFSASTERLPLPDGLQDRLGWLLQIVGVMNARTANGQPVEEPIVLGVAGLRGGMARWTFDVQADTAADPPAWRLVREPQGPYDTRVELWLDTSPPHWPLRVRYAEASGDPLDLVRRAQSATP